MRGRLSALAGSLLLTGACEVGGSQPFLVIPGPSVPSPVPTSAPYVWDTREELGIWVKNPVTRGPVAISLEGDGRDAFIRIEPKRGADGGVLRGPDLTSPARSIRTVRLWYRWRPDPNLSPGATRTFSLSVSFDAVNPPVPPQQPTAYAQLQPAAERTAADARPGSFRDPLDVNYVYFHQFSANDGVLEIDRIELVQ